MPFYGDPASGAAKVRALAVFVKPPLLIAPPIRAAYFSMYVTAFALAVLILQPVEVLPPPVLPVAPGTPE
jgi:hypothetical protein